MRTIADLEQVLGSLQLCTEPKTGHTDPESVTDCWNEANDCIAEIKNWILSNTDGYCYPEIIGNQPLSSSTDGDDDLPF